MNPWTIHCLSVFLLAMAPKRKRAPKKESSLKKQKSVVVKQNVRQNANPKITINLAPSSRKSRATPRLNVLQQRQQRQQPTSSNISVTPVFNINIADLLSNQRTPGIQPSVSEFSMARTATGGNVYKPVLIREQQMPTKQNLTEIATQTDELNEPKDAPGLETPSVAQVQSGDTTSHLTKPYTSDKMEEEDYEYDDDDDDFEDAKTHISYNSQEEDFEYYDNDIDEIESKPQSDVSFDYKDAYEQKDKFEFTKPPLFQSNQAAVFNNFNQDQNRIKNELLAITKGSPSLTKDEIFDGGNSTNTDGTETAGSDTTVYIKTDQEEEKADEEEADQDEVEPVQTDIVPRKKNIWVKKAENVIDDSFQVADLAYNTVYRILRNIAQGVTSSISDLSNPVIDYLSDDENRKKIVQKLQQTKEFTTDVFSTGLDFLDNIVNRTSKSGQNLVKAASDFTATGIEGSEQIITKGIKSSSNVSQELIKAGGNTIKASIQSTGDVTEQLQKSVQQNATALFQQGSKFYRDILPEITENAVLTIKQLDQFIEQAQIPEHLRNTAKLLLQATNASGEIILENLKGNLNNVRELLNEIINFGLDVGVKVSAASEMIQYNRNLRRQLEEKQKNQNKDSNAVIPYTEKSPFNFSIIPQNNSSENRLLATSFQPPDDSNPNPSPDAKNALVTQNQSTDNPNPNPDQKNDSQQKNDVDENPVKNLYDFFTNPIGKKITRSNEVLFPIKIPDNPRGDDKIHANLLYHYLNYRGTPVPRFASRFLEHPEVFYGAWTSLKNDAQFLSSLGYAHHPENYNFVLYQFNVEDAYKKYQNARQKSNKS